MQNLNDDNLDDLLREHFSRQLDPLLGKNMPELHRPTRWKIVAYAGLALAAAIAGIVLMRPAAVQITPPRTEVAIEPPDVKYEMAWQMVEGGTVYLDSDTPMRAYVRREIEKTSWIDPATQAVMEMSVPREQIYLIGMETY